MHYTHVDSYKGYTISALCLDRDEGWEVDCNILDFEGKIIEVPRHRLGREKPFPTCDKAKDAGLEWCQKIVDSILKDAGTERNEGTRTGSMTGADH